MRRVVITGLGVITPLGNSVSLLTEGLKSGKSAIKYMPEWEKIIGLNSKIAAPSDIETVIKSIPRQTRRSMGRSSIMAVLAAIDAVRDSGLTNEELIGDNVGCIIGSSVGSADALEEFYSDVATPGCLNNVSSMQLFKTMCHADAMNVAQYFGIRGQTMASCAACASSMLCIGTSFDSIRFGSQDIMLCGSSEEVHPMVTGSFDIILATSKKYNNMPEKASRPFDRDRDGLVCGEGAGIIILEEYERAKKRGARIYGEILGWSSCTSGVHISQSDSSSIKRCIEKTLKNSRVDSKDIDYVSAHATSTPQGDEEESAALGAVFGNSVPVSSLKGNIGHTLGASGTIELAAVLNMMSENMIYPTLNLENVDPKCNSINHIRKVEEHKINTIMKNSFAFGGINATLVVRKLSDQI